MLLYYSGDILDQTCTCGLVDCGYQELPCGQLWSSVGPLDDKFPMITEMLSIGPS